MNIRTMPGTAALGRLRFDPQRLVLYDGPELVPLAPLPAKMLAVLLSASGELVASAAMREALWGDQPVEERNLNQQMYVLRRVLRRDPRIAIENVPRRGYRLVVAGVQAPPARSRRPLLFASGLAAALALIALVQHQSASSAGAAIARDLSIAGYYADTEGPNHLGRARDYYRAVIARAPDDARGYGGMAIVNAKHALDGAGDDRARAFQSARESANAALQRDPKESNALTALGIVAAVRDRRADVARRDFDAAVSADPAAESPRIWRAKLRLALGDFEGAGRDFRAASQIAPTSGSAVGSFGEWLVFDHQYEGATKILSQAMDLGNHPGFTRFWLARAYHLRGLDKQAMHFVNLCLDLYPNEPSALAVRVTIEVRQHKMRAALSDLQLIERSEVRQPDPIALAMADAAVGKPADAMRVLRRNAATLDFYSIARLRADPDFATLRAEHGFASAITI